jgi:cbb3-type cytochrome oxidase maturation protein
VSVIILLIGFSLLVAVVFLIAFLWAVKNGQYEDRYTPSVRILFDDEKTEEPAGKTANEFDKRIEKNKIIKGES